MLQRAGRLRDAEGKHLVLPPTADLVRVVTRVSSNEELTEYLPPFLDDTIYLDRAGETRHDLYTSLGTSGRASGHVVGGNDNLQGGLGGPILPFSPGQRFYVGRVWGSATARNIDCSL